jgi:hypothetical protein
MTYRITYADSAVTITRLADNVTFPMDERDANYAEYLAWLKKDGTPEVVQGAPAPPPQSIDEKLAMIEAEAAALKKENEALREVLIEKAIITKAEVDAKVDAAVAVEAEVKG